MSIKIWAGLTVMALAAAVACADDVKSSSLDAMYATLSAKRFVDLTQ